MNNHGSGNAAAFEKQRIPSIIVFAGTGTTYGRSAVGVWNFRAVQ